MTDTVYILTNESHPDIIKIGWTSKPIEERMKALDSTGVPLPFQCFFAGEVSDGRAVESLIHKSFEDRRVRSNREFFRIDPNQALAAALLANPKDVTPKNDVVSDETDLAALKRANRRSNIQFSELQIPIGSVLTFVKDEKITCYVCSNYQVNFKGTVMSMSAAALQALRDLGYQWSSVSGQNCWEFNGETLTARRMRIEDNSF